jgi:hypothetical protein
MTARDIISGSLRLINAIASGETPTAAELADGLSSFNDMLESWSNDGLLVPTQTTEALTLVSAQASYTIGAAQNFNTVRPMIIERASVSDGAYETPLAILTPNEYAEIPDKTTQGRPTKLFFDPTVPFGTIKLWPVPSSALTLNLHSRKPLTSFAAATDTVNMPTGYARALRYNLALELAPEYGKEPSALVVAAADDSKQVLSRVNYKPSLMTPDCYGIAERKQYNIVTGE